MEKLFALAPGCRNVARNAHVFPHTLRFLARFSYRSLRAECPRNGNRINYRGCSKTFFHTLLVGNPPVPPVRYIARDDKKIYSAWFITYIVVIVHKQRQRFKRLIEPHAQKLYVVAYRLTGDQADAEDLLQETLLKAYRALDSLKDERNPAGWAFRILKNTYFNALDKNKKVPRPLNDPDHVNQIPAPGMTDGSFNEMDDRLQTALREIPDDMRLMLMARHVEDLTYQEIAQMFGIAVGTVKSRISRGREKLRDHYFGKK